MTSGVVNQIRNVGNLITLFQQQGRLMRRGSRYVTLCPFHNEKSPSCYVNERYFCCFGCGAKGDIFEYIKRRDGVNFAQALRFLADLYGIALETHGLEYKKNNRNLLLKLNQGVADRYQESLRLEDGAMRYLQDERKLSAKIIDHYKLGYCRSVEFSGDASIANQERAELLKELGILGVSKYGKYYDFFRDRIIFPIRDLGGRVIAFGGRVLKSPVTNDSFVPPKYLNSRDSEIFSKSAIFYGWYEASKAIRTTRSVYLVEGYLDVLSLVAAGIENVVATCGTAVTPSHVERLNYLSEVRLVFDGDVAGQKAALRTLVMFLGESVKVLAVILPEGEDPDSYVRRYGADSFVGLPRLSLLAGIISIKLNSYGYVDHYPPAALKKLVEEFAQILADKKIALRSLIWLLCDEFCREVHIITGVQSGLIRDMLSVRVEGYGKEFISRTTGKGHALGVDLSLSGLKTDSYNYSRSVNLHSVKSPSFHKEGGAALMRDKAHGTNNHKYDSGGPPSSLLQGESPPLMSRRDKEFVSAILALDYCDEEIIEIIEEMQGSFGDLAEQFCSSLLASIKLSDNFDGGAISFVGIPWREIKSQTIKSMQEEAEIFYGLLAKDDSRGSEEFRGKSALNHDSAEDGFNRSTEVESFVPEMVSKACAVEVLREMYDLLASQRLKQAVLSAVMVPQIEEDSDSSENIPKVKTELDDLAAALNALRGLDRAKRSGNLF